MSSEDKSETNEISGTKSLIIEGKAKIYRTQKVFYNNVQEFNRDLSVLAVHTFLKNEFWKNNESSKKIYIPDKITILDALSATGLRSIRYSLECKECSLPVEIIANDITESAIKTIESNIEFNKAYNVIVTNEDASMLMYKKKALNELINIIDLDPYGSAAPFLDSAIQTVANGGLLMVTSTDVPVLGGIYGGTCYSKYGSYSVQAKFSHELALRILITSVNSHASRYGRYVIPLLSLSIDFYVRIFFQVFSSPLVARQSASKLSYILICKGCESFSLQPVCQKKKTNFVPSNILYDKNCTLCDHSMRIGGPIWSEPIHKIEFVNLMQNELKTVGKTDSCHFGTFRRMEGMLQLVKEELTDSPLYYHLDRLCCLANCPMPPEQLFRSIVINGGYKISSSHALRNSIKTNAPNEFIWCIIQYLCKKANSKLSDESPVKKILDKNFEYTINATLVKEKPLSKVLNLLRYQINPEPNWGPKSKAQIMKKKRNQTDNEISKRAKVI